MNREQCDNEELRISVGALALDALDADEARQVRRHLAECPECQQEYTSFLGVKRIMDVGLATAPVPGEPRPRKRPAFATPLRRKLAIGTATGVAALGLLLGGFSGGFLAGRGGDSTPADVALPAVTQAGVTARISYHGVGWGTWVEAKMSGAPANVVCTLYVYDKRQQAIQLSSWKSVAGKAIEIPAATSLAPDQIDHFEVRVASRDYEITVPMSGPARS
ncbi:MAG: zf-HC2 domain-containing protein [Catenulispora sp.]